MVAGDLRAGKTEGLPEGKRQGVLGLNLARSFADVEHIRLAVYHKGNRSGVEKRLFRRVLFHCHFFPPNLFQSLLFNLLQPPVPFRSPLYPGLLPAFINLWGRKRAVCGNTKRRMIRRTVETNKGYTPL
jgi:hypothetical protein